LNGLNGLNVFQYIKVSARNASNTRRVSPSTEK
jgi:hypothetical protein